MELPPLALAITSLWCSGGVVTAYCKHHNAFFLSTVPPPTPIYALLIVLLFAFRDPKMLGRLMEEQQTVLEDLSTPLTWEHLGEMELLHDCMRETLRMYPPLVSTFQVFLFLLTYFVYPAKRMRRRSCLFMGRHLSRCPAACSAS